jgi:hypothetical protein
MNAKKVKNIRALALKMTNPQLANKPMRSIALVGSVTGISTMAHPVGSYRYNVNRLKRELA